jgi:arylsulfatase A-like enzyme
MYRSILFFCLAASLSIGVHSARAAEKPNVLFIAIDDLNHWVGYLGRNPQTRTPNIDRFAKSGVAFSKSYCTAPACNPSRASLMSGLRPSTTGCYLNEQNWRPGISEDKLLNTQFAKAGYDVFGAGKIYHGAPDRGGEWTDYFPGDRPRLEDKQELDGVGGLQFAKLKLRDEDMSDYGVVSYGLEKLKEKHNKPFFLAVGLVKPHLPFAVPKKWFDMFPLDSIQLPPHQDDDLDDVPPAGVKMAAPKTDHARVLKSGRWKELVQAYLATIAFCDSQVGRLLDGFEASPYRDNTIVVLWSDHGWSLGEKQHWRKFALWEEPTRTVFAWRVPGVTKPNQMCDRAIDYLCIYPTLCELAGVPLPSHLEGHSIAPLLKDPKAAWEFPAVTTQGFKNHAVRNDNWRYIRYANGDEELYDDEYDPLEYTNLAKNDKYADKKAELAKWLPKTNTPDLPITRGQGRRAGAKGTAKAASEE